MRLPLSRTWPASTSAAASLRVRTTRACQSHLSMRCRSTSGASGVQERSLPCSSCSFSAASLAKGELGSGSLFAAVAAGAKGLGVILLAFGAVGAVVAPPARPVAARAAIATPFALAALSLALRSAAGARGGRAGACRSGLPAAVTARRLGASAASPAARRRGSVAAASPRRPPALRRRLLAACGRRGRCGRRSGRPPGRQTSIKAGSSAGGVCAGFGRRSASGGIGGTALACGAIAASRRASSAECPATRLSRRLFAGLQRRQLGVRQRC